jgi:hypothetical protein
MYFITMRENVAAAVRLVQKAFPEPAGVCLAVSESGPQALARELAEKGYETVNLDPANPSGGPFQGIVLADGFGNIPFPEKLVPALSDLLIPRGALILTTPNGPLFTATTIPDILTNDLLIERIGFFNGPLARIPVLGKRTSKGLYLVARKAS